MGSCSASSRSSSGGRYFFWSSDSECEYGRVTSACTSAGPCPARIRCTASVAFIRVSKRGHDTPVEVVAAQVPEIVECHSITGDDCSIVKVVAPSVAALETVIVALTRCGITSTSLILSSSVERKAIKPAA